MKWSKYNSIIENKVGEYILYNCSTDKIMIFTEKIKFLFEDHVQNLNEIKAIHPDLYNYLLENHFIVDTIIEEEKVIQKKENELNSKEYFRLTLNPTMDCNLRCWYCYETHEQGSHIDETTMKAIKLLLKNKVEKTELKILDISFFGGEPLLKFKQTIVPLLNYVQKLCYTNNIQLNIGFTTNAVLLTSNVVDFLSSLNRTVYIQVPFDGNKELHDKVKKFPNGKGAYDPILKNIKYAIEKNLHVNIRCNYNIDNINSFIDLINEFKSMDKYHYNSFHFSFQPIWQTHDKGIATSPILKNIKKNLNQHGMKYDGNNNLPISCYADREDSIVINYNGDVYKCTAQDFISKLKEGVLNSDGTITYNNLYKDRLYSRFSSSICKECNILPICNICSQKKLRFPNSICPGNITEEDKIDMIEQRIRLISNNKIMPI